MTTFRCRAVLVVVAVALLAGAFGWWLNHAYYNHQLKAGEQAAIDIAKACDVPGWALYFDANGNLDFGGRGPKRPEYAGIYMDSKFGSCPPPERDAAIACAKAEAARRSIKFHHEITTGGCERYGLVE